MSEIGSAYVRIRPRVDEVVPVLAALEQLAREVADALARCLGSLAPPEPPEVTALYRVALDDFDDEGPGFVVGDGVDI